MRDLMLSHIEAVELICGTNLSLETQILHSIQLLISGPTASDQYKMHMNVVLAQCETQIINQLIKIIY